MRRLPTLRRAAAINYRTQDFAEEIKRLTDGRGVDVVLDMVGASRIWRATCAAWRWTGGWC